MKACERCKSKLLYRIFERKYLEFFESWMGTMFSEEPIKGYEWQWADLLVEKGCKQVVGLEDAKRRRGDRIMIACPNGDLINMEPGDKSVHILVPKDYAEAVLGNGRIV